MTNMHGRNVPGSVPNFTSVQPVWERELVGDPDQDFILDGVRNGFRIIVEDAALLSGWEPPPPIVDL